MTEPRIVTPQEAQVALDFLPVQEWHPDYCRMLAHTVATEPDRTRADVAKMLRDLAAELERPQTFREVLTRTVPLIGPVGLYRRADAIESGADW